MKKSKKKKIDCREILANLRKPYRLNQHSPVISNKKKNKEYKDQD